MRDIIELLDKGGPVSAGTLDKMIGAGILPLTFKTHYKMYNMFCIHYKAALDSKDKSPILTAIGLTADDFGVSDMTIRRSIKKMEFFE
jgi:hypothetical protein